MERVNYRSGLACYNSVEGIMSQDVTCQNCGTLFGKEVNGVLNIKHRDLFRTIIGEVKGPCRRCGFEVIWRSDGSGNTRPRQAGL
jgi:hypothetical protein